MTRAGGLRVLIIGGLAVLASCAPLGGALYQQVVGRPGANVPLSADGRADAVEVTLTPGRGARLVFNLRVRTNSVQEVHDSTENDYAARYRFPVTYRISDPNGATLYEQDSNIDWRGNRDTSGAINRQSSLSEMNPMLDQAGGTLRVEARFRSFEVPEHGVVMLTSTLGADTDYGAVAERITLKVEHDIVDPLVNIIVGLFMIVCGWVAAVVGLVIFITAESTSAAVPMPAGDAVEVSAEARRLAIFCHLAGFLGYLVPLGSIIGPLAMWIANRNVDPYVDDQGREALNFQLSLLVYFLLSFALILILIGFLMFPLLCIFQVCMMVIAAVRSNDGEVYRYPLTIRFLH